MASPPDSASVDHRAEKSASASLRAAREVLTSAVLAGELAADELSRRLAEEADRFLARVLDKATGGKTRGYALVGVGGYGRSQLCPGSDLDLVLLHRNRANFHRVAESLWYAIWDDGIRLDHSVRTRHEARSLSQSELKVILGLLDGRVVAGDARVAQRLLGDIPAIWRKGAPAFADELDESVAARHQAAGELAFLLEPDLKQSAGGLRDVAVLRALCAGFPVVSHLAETPAVAEAERLILAARVVLQCRTSSANDRLLLQEQDEVASVLGFSDADALMAAIAEAGRTINTSCDEGWRRVREALRGEPSNDDLVSHELEPGIVLYKREVALAEDARPAEDLTLLVRLASAAGKRNALLSRDSLDRCEAECLPPPTPWSEALRQSFVELLSTGDALVPVVEALDQRHLFELLLPEWKAVRNRPQRNAYHRYTVDRHLLEAVARASEHLAEIERPDLLLIGALLHDIGKGYPGDHNEVGKDLTGTIAKRMGFAEADVATLQRVVAYHLLLPEFATRRDLDDPATAIVVAKLVENEQTLDLLAALTEADSKATGTSAWGPWKAELVATLVERVRSALDGKPVTEPSPVPTAEQLELLGEGKLAVRAHGRRVTVIASDRPGLLAMVAGVLALHGCNVLRASAMPAASNMALETFDVEPAFDRMPTWERVEADVAAALEGHLDLTERLAAQDRTYSRGRRPATAHAASSHVLVDNDTSARASIIEVRALDRLGLLHRITAAFAEAGLDVVSALVDTLGHEVIDTFYVREQTGDKLGSKQRIEEITKLLERAIAPLS